MKGSEVSWRKMVPTEQDGGLSFQIPRRFLPLISASCFAVSVMLMQSMSLESTRSTPESISPDRSCGGFNASGFCCVFDEPRADSASLMHPSIDRETRSTPSSSSELSILGR